MKKTIYQSHHIIYENKEKKQKPVIRKIRKGVHQIVSLIRRYKSLSNQEIDTIKIESELKRNYDKQ